MGLAVELYFDLELENSVRKIRARLTKAGVPPLLDEMGDRPDFHQLCEQIGSSVHEYYLPGRWVPHCTIAQDLGEEEVSKCVMAARGKAAPLAARVEEIGLVEFRPVKSLRNKKLGRSWF